MSTRRRVGFSTSASEASRRQLMQPVPCWEKVWTIPDNAAPGSTLKVYKWVRTDKIQQFSDEEETDQPLAPLPDADDVEVVDGDEEMDQDEANTSVAPETTPISRDVSEPAAEGKEIESKPDTPKPHPLSISFRPSSPTPLPDSINEPMQPSGVALDSAVVTDDLGDGISLDMSGMGPDGEPFEGAQDLSQLQAGDALLGGGLMDETMDDDPFALPGA
ncbi:uncharacterized protein LAESUDRAFT_811662 [Laetiporus sulphureus 93-53]|uniref:Uncharacterized protein n=1 Tax=Laetiporus sulphureus 93-53 TaxID=1314785 RepID=A0A165F1T2_9APHY|nr:uncharacterized protein LAESUDRAFT_811662 [Laetiporus sulphureus 93-53]KZT08193.1 hypothetical protein LAESUDRAFT_811662 [Laetiporus sulphureus 93-53]